MATEASDSVFVSSFHPPELLDLTGIAGRSITWITRIIMFFLYALLFLFALVMVGFIEIRQANMAAFNSLIAVLEQRDALKATDFDGLLKTLDQDRTQYKTLLKWFVCPTIAATQLKQNESDNPSTQDDATNPDLVKICNKIKSDIQSHSYALETTRDDLLTKQGTLEQFYWQYKDGITQQAPQIIPALRFLDSGRYWVRALARSPFEIMEMLLLVCMGMLGA